MKKSLFVLILLSPLIIFSQSDRKIKSNIGLGLKAGVNFANVTKASSINSSNKTGFMAGGFLAPHTSGVLGFRTELIFSRQGYDFKTNTTTGSVTLDYILLPQLTVINIGKVAQLQLGASQHFHWRLHRARRPGPRQHRRRHRGHDDESGGGGADLQARSRRRRLVYR